MGAKTSTSPAATTNTGPCPKGFKSYDYVGFWWWENDVHTCIPPTSGFDKRAVPVGASVATNGACSSSVGSTVPAAPNCPSGYTSVGTVKNPCCSGFTSCSYGSTTVTGEREQRICKQSNGPKVFEAWNKNACFDAKNGVGSGWSQNTWCNGSSGRNSQNNCWLPYSMDKNNKCFAYDLATTGQFNSAGTRVVGVSEYLLDGNVMSYSTSFTPPPFPSKINSGAVAATAGGGAVGGAAVVGIVLFNKKRALKQAPGANVEMRGDMSAV